MINGCRAAKHKKFKSIITLTGFNGNNKISKLGNINFTVDSKSYNLIEKLEGLNPCIKLHTFFVGNNRIKNWDEVAKLA